MNTLLNLVKTVFNGLLKNAPDVAGVAGLTIHSNITIISNADVREKLLIVRKTKTTDAVFGSLTFRDFQCYTMERTAVIIPAGPYNAQVALSPHFGFDTPHLAVSNRTYIEIHPANYPKQLEGCIAVGSQIDGDALDSSRQAFDALIKLLPQQFDVVVSEEF